MHVQDVHCCCAHDNTKAASLHSGATIAPTGSYAAWGRNGSLMAADGLAQPCAGGRIFAGLHSE